MDFRLDGDSDDLRSAELLPAGEMDFLPAGETDFLLAGETDFLLAGDADILLRPPSVSGDAELRLLGDLDGARGIDDDDPIDVLPGEMDFLTAGVGRGGAVS